MEVSLDGIRRLIGTLTLENLALREELERRPQVPLEPLDKEASAAVLQRIGMILQKSDDK